MIWLVLKSVVGLLCNERGLGEGKRRGVAWLFHVFGFDVVLYGESITKCILAGWKSLSKLKSRIERN